MHRDPKQEAQIAEDAGLTAKPEGAPSVANPDARGEEGIEAAIARQKELEQKQAKPEPTRERAPSLDRLDKERASSEGMTPPSSP